MKEASLAVLVVEDDKQLLKMIVAKLKSVLPEWQVLEADSVGRAKEVLLTAPHDIAVVVADYKYDAETGTGADVIHLAGMHRGSPVLIVYTAFALEAVVVRRSYECGADMVIDKGPAQMEHLVHAVLVAAARIIVRRGLERILHSPEPVQRADVLGLLERAASVFPPGTISNMAVVYRWPAGSKLDDDGAVLYRLSGAGQGVDVIRDIPASYRKVMACNEPYYPLDRKEGAQDDTVDRSLVIVPMVLSGECIGAFGIESGGGQGFGAPEVALAKEMAASLSLGLAFEAVGQMGVNLARRVRGRQQSISYWVCHNVQNAVRSQEFAVGRVQRAIIQVAETLADEGNQDLKERCADQLASARDGVEALRKHTLRLNSMVAYLRQVTPEGETELRPTRCGDLFRNLADGVMLLCRQRGVNCRVEGNVDEAEVTLVDQELISQVVQNLVDNSLRISEDADLKAFEISLKAKSERDSEGARLQITVADNGVGIPEDMKASLFQPRITEGGATRAGIGLPYSAYVVAAHGGSLTEEGTEGAAFVIRLPLARPD